MKCYADKTDTDLTLVSPHFTFKLGIAKKLVPKEWTNRITGETIRFGKAEEVGFDFDASEKRIPIVGWRTCPTNSGPTEPNQEIGYADTAFAVDHYEADWSSRPAPLFDQWPESPEKCNWMWARTHLFLTRDLAKKELTLLLGGFGLFDYRYMRVFLNGHEIGLRRVTERWHEPGRFPLGPGSEAHKWLRFDEDNVIAFQASGFMARTPQLDALDPQRNRNLGIWLGWPAQFEQYVLVGSDLFQPNVKVAGAAGTKQGEEGEAEVVLNVGSDALAIVTYTWNAVEPVLHKRVVLANSTGLPRRLMHVRLGSYNGSMSASDGDQGFPVYIDGQFFAGLAHPSGWAVGKPGHFELRQYPGKLLRKSDRWESMDAVFGVAEDGKAREGFLSHLRSRMRRTIAHHDKPYAIFETFGSWPKHDPAGPDGHNDFWGAKEADILHLASKLDEGTKQTGFKFDFFTVELWMDHYGDGERPDLKRFPNRFASITPVVERQGMKFGLWTDSCWLPWTFSGNPVVAPCFNWDQSYGGGDRASVCRATEPFRSMFTNAQLRLARESGVRLFKFDNLTPICYNPHHDHLPGVYSTEAFQSAVVDTLDAIGKACPDAFLMLYWGYRSPWWLLHGDTLFESGVQLEAASPAESPTLYARDSVTVGLDQATTFAVDIPPLGKDSLGVWLSSWGWNSSIGNEQWQGAVIMDICRGSLLAQVWTDWNWLTEPERKQFAEFVGLLRAAPDCFAHPSLILGDPWRHEPYGYRCSDGKRTFVALNNCTWSDLEVPVAKWGLPAGKSWQVVRWYPSASALGSPTAARLRPFEVVLYEVCPAGSKPSLDRAFEPAVEAALEPSIELPARVAVGEASAAARLPGETDGALAKRVTVVECTVPAAAAGGTVAVTVEMKRGGNAAPAGDVGRWFAATCTVEGKDVRCTPILGVWTYASPWQGWRVEVGPSLVARVLRLAVTTSVGADVELRWRGHFVAK